LRHNGDLQQSMSVTSTRPELACEIVPEGVIAARRQPGSGLLASAAFAAFGAHAPTAAFAPYLDKDSPRVGLPGMQTGNPQERDAVVQTVRRALESVGGKNGVVTLIVPDQSVRVLVMDFDALPHKASDAIPLLRFRLKKMLPFDVEEAAISYQVLPAKTGTRAVVAVVPSAVLREYETVVREAGFEPGIVIPSTMACLGMLGEDDATLLVHSSTQCVTTAIASGQELLLHRTQELPWAQEQLAQTMNPTTAYETHSTYAQETPAPLVVDDSMTNVDLGTAMDGVLYPAIFSGDDAPQQDFSAEPEIAWQTMSPESHSNPMVEAPAELEVDRPLDLLSVNPEETTGQPHGEPDPIQMELHHALAVAAAYFEDATGRPPNPVLVAGAMDARTWAAMMGDDSLAMRDLVSLEDMGTAIDSGLSRAQLGAVCGALRG